MSNLKTNLIKISANKQKKLILVGFFIIIGVGTILNSFASINTLSVEPENSTFSGSVISLNDSGSSGGKNIKFSSVRRFFSDDASWNKTVAQLGGKSDFLSNTVNPADSTKNYAKRLWDYGGGYTYEPFSPPGNFRLSTKNYSVPIYDINSATTTARVFQLTWAQSQQGFSNTNVDIGDTIPWNPNWKPGTGNDTIMHIVDYSTGRAYELWALSTNKLGCVDIIGPNAQAGYDPNNSRHICLAAVETYDNLFTAKDGDGSTIPGRGMGINNLALVVRADEVATGNIRHALPFTVSNAMFGPNLVSPITDPTQLGAGISKGFYLPPATRLEHWNPVTLTKGESPLSDFSDSARQKTIPSGMRFAINITDGEIEAWLDSKGYTDPLRSTARTFARAFRDYGGIVAETGGYGIGIETDGVIGPAKDTWARLGIVDDGSAKPFENLLAGLVTEQRLYVVKPPVY